MRFLYSLGILALCITPARAEKTLSLPTLLGQQCVAEISLSLRVAVPRHLRRQQKLEECRLMWQIQAAKVRYDTAAIADHLLTYNSLFKRRELRSGAGVDGAGPDAFQRMWVLELNADATEPASWPRERINWDDYADTWIAILTEAELFLRDAEAATTPAEAKHPCPRANQYGGRCDDADHACDRVPACWVRQWCGRPKDWWSQAYWHRPAGRACPRTLPASVAAGAVP